MEEDRRKGADLSVPAGMSAVLLWAVVPAVKRLLAESLSMYVSSAIVFTLSGLLMYLRQKRKDGFRPLRYENPRYFLCCALPHFLYIACSCFATGLATTRESTVLVNLLTSLWSLCTLVFTVPIMKQRVKKAFPFCLMLSVAGVAFATVTTTSDLGAVLRADGAALFCAALSSVGWGVYSNYYCLIVRSAQDDYLPFVMMGEGLFMAFMALVTGERVERFGFPAFLGIFFQVVLSEFLANLLWSHGMRGKGRMNVILFSNLSPVLSTVAACLLLGVEVKWQFVAGACAIMLATVLSKACLIEEPAKI